MPEKPAAKPVKPVKSAKDVINAMYASGAAKLPDPTQTKKSPIRAPRPARASLKAAPSINPTTHPSPTTTTAPKPVVRPEVSTSLKLNPKKPTIVRPPRVVVAPRKMMDLRPAKGSTQLAISAIKKAAASATPKKPTKPPVSPAPHPSAHPAASGQRLMDDVRRPASVATAAPSPTPVETLQTVAERLDRSEKKTRLRPLDSIKNRFRPAPRGFSAREADQIRPLNSQEYYNPDFEPTAAPTPTPTPERETIHLYGMTEGADTFASAPDLIEPDQTSSDDTNLGVIEDYHPTSSPNTAPTPAPTSHSAKPTAPDNNRYALGGQSPFFLKSITVEKRPLSDAPVVRRPSESSVYSAQNLSEDTSAKNSYAKKSKKFLKSKTVHPSKASDSALNTRPTVIVPARRRSHAPLFVLLIVTVILGAVVGAAVYLFLFQ